MLWNLLPAWELILCRVMGTTSMFLCQVSFSLYTSLKWSGVGRQEDAFLTVYFVAIERNSFWSVTGTGTKFWQAKADKSQLWLRLFLAIKCCTLLSFQVNPSNSWIRIYRRLLLSFRFQWYLFCTSGSCSYT